MGSNTKIEWAHHTFNPWIGCNKVSPGCANCYAEELMDKRYGKAKWGPSGTRVRTSEANWKLPLKWNREAEAKGTRYRVFCASLADVFEGRPDLSEWRANLFTLIMATPHLDWLLLTKRPENVLPLLSRLGRGEDGDIPLLEDWPLPNVWIGTSVENQLQADKRIPELLKIPARVRFLSMEPLLGRVDLGPFLPARDDSEFLDDDPCELCGGSGVREYNDSPDEWGEDCPSLVNHLIDCRECLAREREEERRRGIHWVIVGGESGPNARPMQEEWARSLRDQCQAAGVPFLFKQWGEWVPGIYQDGTLEERLNQKTVGGHPLGMLHRHERIHLGGAGEYAIRIGKKAAGRILDGRTWDEVPEVAHV